MIRALYVIALCLGAVAVGNGCVTEQDTTEHEQVIGTQCGSNVCTGKTFCCNESCGICAPIGGGCTQQVCFADPGNESDSEQPMSAVGGGIASSDDLAPAGAPVADLVIDPIPIGPSQCGAVTCGPGLRCCNASCGACTPPGVECTQQVCSPTD